MILNLEQLKHAVADLPLADRAELAQFVVGTLGENHDQQVLDEWLALAHKRMEQVKAGTVVGIPAEEVMRTLMNDLRRARPHSRDGRSPR